MTPPSPPREPSATYFREISVDPEGIRVLRASSETLVDVVDVASGGRIALHRTIYTAGGRRLAISGDTRQFLAGSWGNPAGGGVACYDTLSGELIWHRRDLGRSQYLAHVPLIEAWFVGLERGGSHVIDRVTGQTRFRLRGMCRFLGAFDSQLVLAGRNCFTVVDANTGKLSRTIRPVQMFSWFRGTHAGGVPRLVCLSSARDPDGEYCRDPYLNFRAGVISGSSLVFSFIRGPVQCYSIADGKLQWEFKSPEWESQFQVVGVDPSQDRIIAIWQSHLTMDKLAIFRLDAKKGILVSRDVMPDGLSAVGRFACNGSAYVDGAGRMDLGDGTVRRFE